MNSIDTVDIMALRIREAINISIVVFALVLCTLLAHYVVGELRKRRYCELPWETKLTMGLWFIFTGELFRSATIWQFLHFRGSRGTYIPDMMPADIVPLLIALIFIPIGSLCAIRVMSPERWGRSLWVSSLVVAIVLVTANYFL